MLRRPWLPVLPALSVLPALCVLSVLAVLAVLRLRSLRPGWVLRLRWAPAVARSTPVLLRRPAAVRTARPVLRLLRAPAMRTTRAVLRLLPASAMRTTGPLLRLRTAVTRPASMLWLRAPVLRASLRRPAPRLPHEAIAPLLPPQAPPAAVLAPHLARMRRLVERAAHVVLEERLAKVDPILSASISQPETRA